MPPQQQALFVVRNRIAVAAFNKITVETLGMKNSIEFDVRETDTYPLEVTLEPEADVFVVRPGERLAFAPSSPSEDFRWALRIDHQRSTIQLYPESKEYFGKIKIYKNSILDESWESLL